MIARNYIGTNTEEAFKYASELHNGQVDKKGEDYINHPVRVSYIVLRLYTMLYSNFKLDVNRLQTTALLHDVLEDCNCGELYDMVDYTTYCDIDLLSHAKNTKYTDYIQKLVDSGTVYALLVKLADLIDNLDEQRLNQLDEQTKNRLIKKYKPAFNSIKRALNEIYGKIC